MDVGTFGNWQHLIGSIFVLWVQELGRSFAVRIANKTMHKTIPARRSFRIRARS